MSDPVPKPALRRELLSILFADVSGFSKLPEHSIPAYIQHFLGGAATILASCDPCRIRSRNTWGDALFAIFNDPHDAALMALDLRDWAEAQDWPTLLGLSAEAARPLRLRIGLHAGLIFVGRDEIIGEECFMGGHTSLAARLEPIAEEGQILATEEFACLTADHSNCAFDYQGIATLPKNAGRVPVYALRRRMIPA